MTTYQPMHEFVPSPFLWREAVAAGYVSQRLAEDPNVRTKTYSKWQGTGTTSRATSKSPWAAFREKHEPTTEVRSPAKPKKGHADLALGPLSVKRKSRAKVGSQ